MKQLRHSLTERLAGAARFASNRAFSLVIALVCLSFLLSLLGWVLGDPSAETVLYFPRSSGHGLAGELRGVPRTWGREARARVIAEDYLLGPASAELSPVFDRATRLKSCLYREGVLYIDLAEEAALVGSRSLELGIEALAASVRGAMPGRMRIVVAVGGLQVYPPAEASLVALER